MKPIAYGREHSSKDGTRCTMHCPACGTEAPEEDRFCEACDSLLVVDTDASQSPAGPTGACTRCGAGPEEIDAQGFCTACGLRRRGRERAHLEMTLSPHFGGVTDRGLSHPCNEDALALAQVKGREAYVLVVCDGVSSSQAADLASQAAAEVVCNALTKALHARAGLAEATMRAAVDAALLAVRALPYTSVEDSDPPSTTLVAAVVCEGRATIGWVG